MKINILIIAIAVLILSFCAIHENNFLDYTSPVEYAHWQSISLKDFKGLKLPGQDLDGMSEFAFIETSRVINFERDKKQVSITTYFYPSRSYVFDQSLWSKALLTHELYHLHITEYFSRLFRKQLSEYQDSISTDQILELEGKYHWDEMKMQMQYDDDSYHSYVVGQQKAWQQKVDSCLQSLTEFSNPVIFLKK